MDAAEAGELFDAVQRDLATGRSRAHLVADLVHQRWAKSAAQEFVDCARQARAEYQASRAGQAETARKASSQMTSSAVWIAGGAIAAWSLGRLSVGMPLHYIGWFLVFMGSFEFMMALNVWLQTRHALTGPPADSAPPRPRR